MDAEFPQLRIHLQAAHRGQRGKVHFTCRVLGRPRLVRQAGEVRAEEAIEGLIHACACGLQIAGNRGDVPAIEVQVDDRSPPRLPIVHLHVGWIASLDASRKRVRGQDALDRIVMDPAVVAAPANGGDLAWAKSWVLRFQRQDALADLRRHLSSVIRSGRGLVVKETGHPGRVEEICLPCQRTLGDARRRRTLSCRLAEQGDRPQDLVHLLLVPSDIEVNLVKIVSWLAAWTFRCRH